MKPLLQLTFYFGLLVQEYLLVKSCSDRPSGIDGHSNYEVNMKRMQLLIKFYNSELSLDTVSPWKTEIFLTGEGANSFSVNL